LIHHDEHVKESLMITDMVRRIYSEES